MEKLFSVNEECREILKQHGINNILIGPMCGNCGRFIEVSIDGVLTKRKVYDEKLSGLYIIVKNVKIFDSDIEYVY